MHYSDEVLVLALALVKMGYLALLLPVAALLATKAAHGPPAAVPPQTAGSCADSARICQRQLVRLRRRVAATTATGHGDSVASRAGAFKKSAVMRMNLA